MGGSIREVHASGAALRHWRPMAAVGPVFAPGSPPLPPVQNVNTHCNMAAFFELPFIL